MVTRRVKRLKYKYINFYKDIELKKIERIGLREKRNL